MVRSSHLVVRRSGRAVLAVLCALSASQSVPADDGLLPIVKFFYYDAKSIRWVVSAEPEVLQTHLQQNADSKTLYESLVSIVGGDAEPKGVRRQITRWLDEQRRRFDQTGMNKLVFRKSEGITAYLRSHEFSISTLVDSLKKLSGASDVELVAVHLVDKAGSSSYLLKVILVAPTIDVGQQGFNVDIRTPQVTGISVVFALGVALYEVQEIINQEPSEDAAEDDQPIEPLPLPELQFGSPLTQVTERDGP